MGRFRSTTTTSWATQRTPMETSSLKRKKPRLCAEFLGSTWRAAAFVILLRDWSVMESRPVPKKANGTSAPSRESLETRSTLVMLFCRRPSRLISSRRLESRMMDHFPSITSRTVIQPSFRRTSSPRFRKRWPEGQTCSVARMAASAESIQVNTLYQASAPAADVGTSTEGLPGTIEVSIPLSGDVAPGLNLGQALVMLQQYQSQNFRWRLSKQSTRC